MAAVTEPSTTPPAPSPADDGARRRVLEFYREDTPGMARALILAAALISIGGLLTLLGALSRQIGVPPAVKTAMGIAGSMLLAIGLVRGFIVFPSVLWRERSLSIEKEGVRFTWHDREPEFYAWSEVNVFEGTTGALLLRFTDGSVRAYSGRFGGKEFTDLAKSLESCRRKAQFSLL